MKARPEQYPHINISIQAIPLFQHHPHPLGTQTWISFTELFILTKCQLMIMTTTMMMVMKMIKIMIKI